MGHKLLLFVLLILLVSNIISCSPSRHHKDPHKKYRVITQDSTQRVRQEDHMHDNNMTH